jgi:hypothetical protein
MQQNSLGRRRNVNWCEFDRLRNTLCYEWERIVSSSGDLVEPLGNKEPEEDFAPIEPLGGSTVFSSASDEYED